MRAARHLTAMFSEDQLLALAGLQARWCPLAAVLLQMRARGGSPGRHLAARICIPLPASSCTCLPGAGGGQGALQHLTKPDRPEKISLQRGALSGSAGAGRSSWAGCTQAGWDGRWQLLCRCAQLPACRDHALRGAPGGESDRRQPWHSVPALDAALAALHGATEPSTRLERLSVGGAQVPWPITRWPMHAFTAGACLCLLLSSFCHLMGCCSFHNAQARTTALLHTPAGHAASPTRSPASMLHAGLHLTCWTCCTPVMQPAGRRPSGAWTMPALSF